MHWLVSRRGQAGTWHPAWNRSVRVKRMSNDLFDFEVHAIATDDEDTVRIGVLPVPFVLNACIEFTAMGLLAAVPDPKAAPFAFAQVVAGAIAGAEANSA